MAKSQKVLKRRKTFNRINYKDRVIIENRYCADRISVKETAKELSRHITTITREVSGKPRIGRGKYCYNDHKANAM